MTILGWILMILSWAFIIALTIFCFAKVLGKKEERDTQS